MRSLALSLVFGLFLLCPARAQDLPENIFDLAVYSDDDGVRRYRVSCANGKRTVDNLDAAIQAMWDLKTRPVHITNIADIHYRIPVTVDEQIDLFDALIEEKLYPRWFVHYDPETHEEIRRQNVTDLLKANRTRINERKRDKPAGD